VRVAIVVERFEQGAGGVESAAFHLVHELVRREVDVTVVCRRAADAAPVPVVRLEVADRWQPWRLLAFSARAARATARGFDRVHSFSRTRHQHVYRAGGGSHAAYMERVYRHPRPRRLLSPRHRAILHIEEAVFRDPTQTIQCNSQLCAREIAARYAVPPTRLATIYNGVDTERFRPELREREGAAGRARLGLEGPVALFVGSGFARKGLDRALEGLARSGVPATLLVAGAGDVRPYRRMAERLGVAARVRFLGRQTAMPELYAVADLLVLPTRYDAFANACLEAMASGLPVATTRVNGVAEILTDGRDGFLLAEDFAPAFARLDDLEGLAAAGRAARATAERFGWARHAAEVLALYARVAA
jgi:UDP-glucose:(heptosyl)LPS alpha-1,3-glucosyltransferase